jgi:WD40 repeat protein
VTLLAHTLLGLVAFTSIAAAASIPAPAAGIPRLLRTLPGHVGRVTAVAFSPDGLVVASAGRDEYARLWRPEPGTSPRELRHPEQVQALAFDPTGRLFTLSRDGQLWGWDPDVPRCLGSLPEGSPIRCFALDAEGRRVGTGTDDGRIRVHDMARGVLVQVRDADEGTVTCLAFAPGGRRLVSGGTAGPLNVWELEADAATPLIGHQGAVRRIVFTPAGDALLSAGADGTAREWDASTWAPRHAFTHRGGVRDLAVSPDGTLVATAGDDGLVNVWARQPARHLATLHGHRGPATGVAFNATGLRLVSGGEDGAVRVWDVSGLPPARATGQGVAGDPGSEAPTSAPTAPASPTAEVRPSASGGTSDPGR